MRVRSALMVALLAGLALALPLAALAEDAPTLPGSNLGSGLPAVGGPRAPGQDAFQKLAKLASRLTIYNSHDDAATATYTCCRPDQKEQIAKAQRANELFLERFPQSDFADDTLFHMARLAEVQDNVLVQVQNYERLVAEYPGSDLADDALFRLSQLYGSDAKSRELGCQVLAELLDKYPLSTHAAQSLASLVVMAIQDRDSDRADAVSRDLYERFPRSAQTGPAMLALANAASENGALDQAAFYYDLVINEYPYCDCFDDAMWGKTQMIVRQGAERPSRVALENFLNTCPASPHFREAAQEYNRVRKGNVINVGGVLPVDEAEELWAQAEHARNFREFSTAVDLYKTFLNRFPGNDHFDNALLGIGLSYKEAQLLCNTINEANGPEDLHRVRDLWARASGGGSMPKPGEASTADGAFGALMEVAFGMPGTGLAAEALYELAEVFEDMKLPEVRAQVFQRLIVAYPDSNPDYGTEALAELLEWYVKDAQWPDQGLSMYAELSNAYPGVFPPQLGNTPDLLMAVLKSYEKEASHAWYERRPGHLSQRTFGVADLVDDSMYVLGGLLVNNGDVKGGAALLAQVADNVTCDFAPLALYDLARAYEKQGKYKDAARAYEALAVRYPGSGLADDAEDCYAMLDGTKDFSSAVEALPAAEAATGRVLRDGDFYVGQHVVVFSPYLSAAKLRMYNMPNVWDQAVSSLAKWTGDDSLLAKKQVIVLTEEPGSEAGEVIRLSAQDIGDPPNWELGLAELTQKALATDNARLLRGMGEPFYAAMVRLGTANLQYALVSETRDTIGSAEAVKLPFQQLIELVANARGALDTYVKDGAPGADRVSREVAQGMLLALLDQYGYGQNGVIDCSPFETFFDALRERNSRVDAGDRDACAKAVIASLGEAFNDNLTPTFEKWGIGG